MLRSDLLFRLAATAGMMTAAILVSACGGADADPSGAAATATDARDVTSNAYLKPKRIVPPAAVADGVYFVDSVAGNDANSGTAPTPGADGIGPWRSLAKIAATSFAPGNSIQLVCGSVWTETLTLKTSGTAGNPISIGTYPTGCTSPPTISGSVQIAPSAWTLHKGNIYKAALSTAPLLVTSPAGTLTAAHHPNRGFDSTQPTSLYLRAAADSDNVVIEGRARSTYVTTGTDLVLPPGASLPAGTGVRVRTNPFTIDESTIAAVAGNRITLTKPTSRPLTKGWGYYLFGQLWMLDSPSEWHWDSATKTVYVWMPDGAAPAEVVRAAILPTGVDLNSRKYIRVENLRVYRTGTGVSMRDSVGISLQGVYVADSADVGIDGTNGTDNVVKASTIRRSGGTAAISGSSSSSMQIIDNTITDAGAILNGDTVLSLPRSARGIIGGFKSLIAGNSITNSSYTGISVQNESTVSGNFVYGSCSVLDDCAGIYTSGTNKFSTIANNIVQHTRGNVEGNASPTAKTQAQGIYLDDHASEVTVTGNTVVDADYGIQVHISTNNLVSGNKLYGNRYGQLLVNETSASGDVRGNTFTDNQIVRTTPDAYGMFLLSLKGDTKEFGQFDRNIYLDRIYATMGRDSTPSGATDYTFQTWQTAKLSDGSPRHLDVNGKATSKMQYAPALIDGANILPNGNLASAEPAWRAWNGTLIRQSCAPGYCASYTGGSAEGILSTPKFSVKKDQWYRVSIDVLAGTDGQKINMLVRRSGGGSNGYESLSNTYFTSTAGRTWKRFSFTMQATATVNAADPITGDNGARLDIERVQPGQVITVTNAEIVPISSVSSATKTALLLNTGAIPIQAKCPDAAKAPESCNLYVRLTDSAPVAWPYNLPARSSEIIYTLDPALIDSDADGIADSQDRCPGSAAGAAVNAAGCGI